MHEVIKNEMKLKKKVGAKDVQLLKGLFSFFFLQIKHTRQFTGMFSIPLAQAFSCASATKVGTLAAVDYIAP